MLFTHLSLWLCLHHSKYCLVPLTLRRRWFSDWPKHNLKHKDWLLSCIQWVKAAPVGAQGQRLVGPLNFSQTAWETHLVKIFFNRNSQENVFQNKTLIIMYLPHSRHLWKLYTGWVQSSMAPSLTSTFTSLQTDTNKTYRIHYFCHQWCVWLKLIQHTTDREKQRGNYLNKRSLCIIKCPARHIQTSLACRVRSHGKDLNGKYDLCLNTFLILSVQRELKLFWNMGFFCIKELLLIRAIIFIQYSL